jgi:prepilin-type N-terminal cleavage/methylation domain-containing protein
MMRTRTAGGFSLVELLIAMALIAIVAAIAVPQFQRYAANADLKTAAREVASDFFNTRQQALQGRIGENLNYRLTFDVGANSYTLSSKETTVATWNTAWTKSIASFGGGISIYSINFSGGSVVNFQKRGTLSSWGDVILRNGRDSRATVTVNSTGRTYVTFAMQ